MKIQYRYIFTKNPDNPAVIVSPEDYDWLIEHNWYLANGYAVTKVRDPNRPGKWKTLRMHRLIMNTPPGMDTDHINGAGHDNRRENLRVCTRSQNQWNSKKPSNNTSGFKGVYWANHARKWKAQIATDGKNKHIGYFTDPEEAHKAYCEAAKELFGEYARAA